MPTVIKQKKKGSSSDNLSKLQKFVEKVKTGKIMPFKEKTERAKKNLKKAGLIK